ncbi:MAG: L17 family ribosomal protein [Planctomycetia bacterium]|nr:L17 family ribosomal protein [Planctomycetia bacterium]
MRHRRIGKKFGRNPSHQRALLRNLAIALILTERDVEDYDDSAQAAKTPGRIVTTLPKAKELRPFIEKLITKAVHAQKSIEEAKALACTAEKHSDEWNAWRNGEGWKAWVKASAPAVAARRAVYQKLNSREAVSLLFDKIAPRYVDRQGGYTRILKLAKPRLGDAGRRALIEFVGKDEYRKSKQTSAIPQVEE